LVAESRLEEEEEGEAEEEEREELSELSTAFMRLAASSSTDFAL